ncbi:MAG: ShlB/FhaC/HecB family hemolysin secretion/activation protein [Proteobacteria bacterium]|nr:ShlB/FhaC/HecB family hemolysin secretion/activation protein [Pseudomonadota bacterium]
MLAAPAPARSQQTVPSPSQVAPSAIPRVPAAPARIILPRVEAGAAIPPGAKKLSFHLTGFVIEGEFAELVDARRKLAASLVGKSVSVAQVFEFATALQAAYIRAGYPLVRVVVAPQELGQAATIKLNVVDGFIERIDASSIGESARGPVLAVVASLVNKRHLTQADLERRLLIAGETPGLVLNAVFSAGKQVGGVVLVVTGRYRPVSLSVYSDDAMPQVFGTGQIVTTVSLNSVLGLGEQFTVSAAGLPDKDFSTAFPTRRYLSTVLSMPLGTDGWMLEGGFTKGKTTPRVDPLSSSQGDLTQGYGKLSYSVIKRRDRELTFSTRFDATDEQIESLAFSPPIPLSLDRLRVLRFGAEGVWRVREWGTVIGYGAVFSRGLNAFGARMAADADWSLPLSRNGADAVFSKLQGHLDITQRLPEAFFASFSSSAQTSFNKPLLSSEQFDIAGARMLSGYTGGSFSGDMGWVVRGEFGRDFVFANSLLPGILTPYAFAATGERLLELPTNLEVHSVHASNAGFGLRMNATTAGEAATDVSGFIEVSRRHSDDGSRQGWRLFAGGSVRY